MTPRWLGSTPPGAALKFTARLLLSASQRKHTRRWLRSLRPDYLLEAPLPWLAFDAIDFIAARLPRSARVFEYGSGGSTLFWLSRGAACVSIEHDPAWYALIARVFRRMRSSIIG